MTIASLLALFSVIFCSNFSIISSASVFALKVTINVKNETAKAVEIFEKIPAQKADCFHWKRIHIPKETPVSPPIIEITIDLFFHILNNYTNVF